MDVIAETVPAHFTTPPQIQSQHIINNNNNQPFINIQSERRAKERAWLLHCTHRLINFIGMVESESSRKTTPQSASRPSTTVCCVDVVKYTTLMLVKFVVKFHATCIHTYHSLFSTYTYTLTHTHTQHTLLIVQMQTRPRRRVTLCVCVYTTSIHWLYVCGWVALACLQC